MSQYDRVSGIVGSGRNRRVVLPESLQPIRSLLLSNEPTDRMVLDDWIESQSWNVAHDMWLASRPTLFQQNITVMVIGRGTTLAHYPDIHKMLWRSRGNRGKTWTKLDAQLALNEAQRQLRIHSHALWVRVIMGDATTRPQGQEALLDLQSDDWLPEAYDDCKIIRCKRVRTRCDEPGCVNLCFATQRVPE